MMTIKEIADILEFDEIRESERIHLEQMLEDLCKQELSKLSKTIVAKFVDNLENVIDVVDLCDKVKETGSDDIQELAVEIVKEKIGDITGPDAWVEIDLEDNE